MKPRSPYKGLIPFDDTDLDALLFFGREREREIIVANLMASRLTVLYGPSGVGKTSLLRAGVAHRLRRWQGADFAVVVFATWSGDPRGELVDAAAHELRTEPPEGPLADALAVLAERAGGNLYVILDQFEEYFLCHDGLGDFGEELAEAVNRRGLRVNFLVSLREDALASLDVFKGAIPNLFANYLRLDHLDREAARAALTGPVQRWNSVTGEHVGIEGELVEAVLDEVTAGKVDLGHLARGGVETAGADGRVEAPYLQLVMERLWHAERASGSAVLRLETLRQLGGAATIVRTHLERAVEELTPTQKDVAARVFHHLVTPSGAKIAHGVSDLAQYAAVAEDELRGVLTALERERIVRGVDGTGTLDGRKFEIFHDVLADPVLAWRAARDLERERAEAERRQRRLLAIAAAALIGLVAVGALGVYAAIQRQDARESERKARARALIAESAAQLDVDPQRSLTLALRAARLEPRLQVERQLRRALLEARLRRTIHIGERAPSPISVATIDASARRVLVAGRGAVRVVDIGTGRAAFTLDDAEAVTSASFVSEGRIVTGSDDGAVVFWNGRNGRRLARLDAGGPVRSVTVAPDGRATAVVAADGRGRVRTRFYRGSRLIGVLPQKGVSDAEFSPNGDLLATSSADGATVVWNATSGKRLRVFDDEGGAVRSITFSPNGSLLATASSDFVVRVWDVAKAERLFFFTEHRGPVTGVAFDPTGMYVASTGEDRTARVWQVGGPGMGRQVALLAPHSGVVRDAAFSLGGKSLVTVSDDATARVWDAEIEQRLKVVARVDGPVAAAAFAEDGVRSVAGSVVETRRPGGVVKRERIGKVFALAPGGAVASAEGDSVTVLHPSVGRSAATFELPGPVVATAFGRDDRQLVAVGGGGRAGIVDVPSGRLTRRLTVARGVTRIALAPDGSLIATGHGDGVVRVYERDGRLLHRLHRHRGAVTDVRFDPSGRRLVSASTGSRDNAVVWDARTGRLLEALVGHAGTVTAASFSADGRWIATAGPIAVGVWAADTRLLLFYLRGPTELFTDAEWSPRGYRIVTAARDGTVRTYACDVCRPLDGLIRLARARLAAAR